MRFVLSGMAAVILSWVFGGILTGCRFGNYYEETTNVNPLTGYYETQPVSLNFCATLGGVPPSQCPSANITEIPNTISSLITQPVALQILNSQTGSAGLFDPFTTVAPIPWFPITVDFQTLLLNFSAIEAPQTLWHEEACTVQTSYDVRGALHRTPATVVRGKTTQGRLTLFFQVKDQFSTQCAATLGALAACYQDPSMCNEGTVEQNLSVQRQVRGYLGPYVRTGAVGLPNVSQLTALDYEVSYE